LEGEFVHRYIVKQFFQLLVTLFLVSIVIFIMGRISGNPCGLLLPDQAGPEEFALCAKNLGLDKPIYVQYQLWITAALHGNLGTAFVSHQPVIDLIMGRFPNSFKLGIVSMIFTTLISFPLGMISAIKKDRLVDIVCKVLALLGQSVPSFWLGIMLIWVFAVHLRLLPVSGIGGPEYYVMPVLTMGWWTVAAQTRLIRSSMLEVLDSEYIKLARIKGVSERMVIWKHALRNALIPVVSFLGIHFAQVIVMAMIAEVVFAWPGLGRLLYDAIRQRDFPIIQGVVLFMTTVTVVVNMIVDVFYAYIDPRIRY
jgi:peptide/nickel transport system permease protein